MSAKNWTFVTSKQVWLDTSLSLEAKVVWHVLSAFRNHGSGQAFPKTYTLQKITGCGRHKVERAITELVKAGAIKKEVVRRRGTTGMMGSKCIYTVGKLSDWKAKAIYAENVSVPFLGPPESGATSHQHLTISQYQTITQPQSVTQSFSPAKPGETSKLLSTETEIEDLLADRDASVASAVWERICSAPGRDRHGRHYRSREEQEKCIRGFADHIEECRAGTR